MKITQKDYIAALGVENKLLQENESKFRPIFRKGLYWARDVRKGEMIEPDMLVGMRPKIEGALPSEEYPNFLGKLVNEDAKRYEPLT